MRGFHWFGMLGAMRLGKYNSAKTTFFNNYNSLCTMRILFVFALLLLTSCFEQTSEVNRKKISVQQPEKPSANNHKPENSVDSLNGNIHSLIQGNWCTTILPDSILRTKKVYQWGDIFYGTSLITIRDNDSLTIQGIMDRGSLRYEIIDNSTIFIPDWGAMILYTNNQLVWLNDPLSRTYKRCCNNETTKILTNEKQLMKYIQSILFNEDYLPSDLPSKIKHINLGLETDYSYSFNFDVIGIEEKGETNYYAWEFSGDTLNLYNALSIDNGSMNKRGNIIKQYYPKE